MFGWTKSLGAQTKTVVFLHAISSINEEMDAFQVQLDFVSRETTTQSPSVT